MADIADSLEANALAPAEAESKAGRVKQQSLADQIAADQYLAARRAASATSCGLRFSKMILPPQIGNVNSTSGEV